MPGCDTHSELRSVFERACIGVLSVSTADARDGMWYHISCDHVLGGLNYSSTSTALWVCREPPPPALLQMTAWRQGVYPPVLPCLKHMAASSQMQATLAHCEIRVFTVALL